VEQQGSNGGPRHVVGPVIGWLALAALLVVDLSHGVALNSTLLVVALATWLLIGRHTERHVRTCAAVLVPVSLLFTGLALSESRHVVFSGTEVAALLCTAASAIRWYRKPIDAIVAGACMLAAVGVALRAAEDTALTVGVVVALAIAAGAIAGFRRATADRPARAAGGPVDERRPEATATFAADPSSADPPTEPPYEPPYVAPSPAPVRERHPIEDLEPDWSAEPATQVQPVVPQAQRVPSVQPAVAVAPVAEQAEGNPFAVIRARAAELSRSGVRVKIELDPPAPPAIDWTPELSAAVVSIVQEALTNVRLHAVGAQNVQLHFHLGADHLDLRITDDGNGAPPSRPAGGLLKMQRQAAKVAGRVRTGPTPTGGWEVRAVLPAIRRTTSTQA
jgi:signal transduction histidine kinase